MSLKYRPEIDGLRAIAVFAVVFFHAEFVLNGAQLLTGGYIGVDVFFVISGYLITSIILKEVSVGKFSFLQFYDRRARRILPALFTVIFASIPFAWLYLLPQALKAYASSILSALLFGSNIWFWQEDSYWTEPSALKPFLHTWSLSVEEQFYVLFPILLLLIYKYSRQWLMLALVLILALSLQLAEIGSRNFANANFYLLPMRGWELMAGAILAQLELTKGRITTPALNKTMPLLGLILILVSLVLFNEQTRHPSYLTVLPVLGSMLIIWFSNKKELATKILSSKPFVSTGLISYGFYLWHFPVFAFSKIRDNMPTAFDKVTWIIISLLLSVVTYKYIEQRFRNREKISTKALTTSLSLSALILVGINSIFITDSNNILAAQPLNDKLSEFSHLGKFVGDKKTQPSFVIFGDSHAQMYVSKLEASAIKNNFSFMQFTHPACFSFPDITNYYPGHKSSNPRLNCINMHKNLLSYLAKNDVPVLLSFAWHKTLSQVSKHEPWLKIETYGHVNTKVMEILFENILSLRQKSKTRKPWVILGKVPGSGNIQYRGYAKCLSNNLLRLRHQAIFDWLPTSNDPVQCAKNIDMNKGMFFHGNLLLERFSNAHSEISFINPYNYLCEKKKCNSVHNGNILYTDHHHLSNKGAAYITPHMLRTILK